MSVGYNTGSLVDRVPGYDVWYMECGRMALERCIAEAGGNRDAFAVSFIGMSSIVPRPIKGEVEVAGIEPHPTEDKMCVTLRVRRGHHQQAQFMSRHKEHSFCIEAYSGHVHIWCPECSTRVVVPYESFPSYDFNLLPSPEDDD